MTRTEQRKQPGERNTGAQIASGAIVKRPRNADVEQP
jgi:hypothetical protein